MRPRYVLLALSLLTPLAVQAQASPDAEALVAAWRAGWQATFGRTAEVGFQEQAERVIEGPRERTRLSTRTDVRFVPGSGADRTIVAAEVNGRRVPPGRLAFLERRLQRAYGPGYAWIHRPPPLPARYLEVLRPVGRPQPDRFDGTPVWRVDAEPRRPTDRIERATLWFARAGADAVPRLLRSRIVGVLPEGGSAVQTTEYVHIGGLDLPRRSEVEVVFRQRRRNRLFTILLNAETTYREYAVRPR